MNALRSFDPPPGAPALRLAARILAASGMAGCMPWTGGQPANTVPAGERQLGMGVGTLVYHEEWSAPVPVPQLWFRRGLGPRTDLGLTYAAPGTLQGDLKRRVGGRDETRLTVSGGAGLHTVVVPEDLGEGGVGWIPFLSGAFVMDRQGNRAPPREHQEPESAKGDPSSFPYAQLRAFAPFALGDGLAATLWLVPSVGWHRGGSRLSWGPELGVVVLVTQPSHSLILGAVSVRWD